MTLQSSLRTWRQVRLGSLLRIKHGYAFKGEFFSDDGPYVLLTPGNFKESGGIQLRGEREKYYTGKFPEEFLLRKGDLLVVMTDLTQNAPILGASAFIVDDDRMLHNQRLGKVVDVKADELDTSFLFYLFNSSLVRDQLKATATGATVKHTAPNRIYDVVVGLPSLPTQIQIVDILSAYDDLIENNTRRIAILEEMARNLYREWFVEFRFPGHEQVLLVESELGRIPEGWTPAKLGDVSEIVMGQSPRSEFYNTEGNGLPFHQGVTDFGHRFPTNRMFCSSQGRIAQEGDILFSVRAPVGRINIARERMIVGRGLAAIRSSSNKQIFLFHHLTDIFQEEDLMGGGSIFKAVTRNDMRGIMLLMPLKALVEQFEHLARSAFDQIAVLSLKNINLRRTRDLLIPKLISGEIKIGEP